MARKDWLCDPLRDFSINHFTAEFQRRVGRAVIVKGSKGAVVAAILRWSLDPSKTKWHGIGPRLKCAFLPFCLIHHTFETCMWYLCRVTVSLSYHACVWMSYAHTPGLITMAARAENAWIRKTYLCTGWKLFFRRGNQNVYRKDISKRIRSGLNDQIK